MREETFADVIERAMTEVDGKSMLVTDALKYIMRAIGKKLDEDRNASISGNGEVEDRETAQRRP